MSHYRFVAIETFRNPGEPSSASVRARPLPNQGLSLSMRVECSSKMRKDHPIGTVFIIQAQIISKESGSDFLYTHYNSPYTVILRSEAEEKINTGTLSP
mgnify:CR=1 FL=1